MVFIIFLLFQQTCSAKVHPSCPPSSCGKIRNISYPFRLKGDPRGCGLQRYELECLNNVTVLTLFAGKYHVQEINYKRYQIRVTDAGVVEDTPCYFPRYFLFKGNLSNNFDLYYYTSYSSRTMIGIDYQSIAFLNCSNPVTNDPRYVQVDTAPCNSGGGGYVYAVLQYHDYPGLRLSDIKVGCCLKVVTLKDVTENLNASYAVIRKSLSHGFLLSWWIPVVCREQCGKGVTCYLNKTTEQVQCNSPRVCRYLGLVRTNCVIKPGTTTDHISHNREHKNYQTLDSHANNRGVSVSASNEDTQVVVGTSSMS
ncbi:hypothetical protein Fmac_020466 [Flemingia macrophylla]|uniref:Wall-associated receptor kinase galacturonan-binding domain-containing protein n=1 Tax=Flemingia macrophylla TaxID=520843 RepID=A0ABD1LU26_9FABA